MTTSEIPTLPIYSPLEQPQMPAFPHCTLKWRQGQLLVRPSQPWEQLLPALENQQWLVECLSHSPVRLIQIDPGLGETNLQLWAEACQQASKALFLQLPSSHKSRRRAFSWGLRLTSWFCAAILLLFLSPLMLGIALLLRVRSPHAPVFYQQWGVGERGKFFRLLKFRTHDKDTTLLGQWLCEYRLEELPQLFHVLRGEMNLFGPRPWTLPDVVQIAREYKSNR